jgi:hypothetical protein
MRISFVLIHVTNQGGLSWPFRLGLILMRLRCGPGRRRPRTDRRLGVSWLWRRSMMGRPAPRRIGDVTLQIVRDRALKFNAHGPGGLLNRQSPRTAAAAQRCAEGGHLRP